MQIHLTPIEKQSLEAQHRRERDSRICDRLKAVLLRSEGGETKAIAQALRLHEETIKVHLQEWEASQKVKPENGGSTSKLSTEQARELSAHLEQKTYLTVNAICIYVNATYGILYTVSGMTKWLRQHHFRYKQPNAVPAKADLQKQREFIETYRVLGAQTPAEEPILFMDSAHPTMATNVVCGWIKKGHDKPIAQTASRTRVNITGAINLRDMTLTSHFPEYVNAESTIAFFDQLNATYPDAPTLHVILDQSGYHKSKAVQEAAAQRRIQLHYLPPYSPNLNPIERIWKFMNERVRNNVFFASAKEFRECITDFFDNHINQLLPDLRGRIHDHFQTLKTVS